MLRTTDSKWRTPLEVLIGAVLLCLTSVANASAEIRTISATGEYRMGDNDTRTDAKRLALLDAKRLALEQAGTYIESITEVKNGSSSWRVGDVHLFSDRIKHASEDLEAQVLLVA